MLKVTPERVIFPFTALGEHCCSKISITNASTDKCRLQMKILSENENFSFSPIHRGEFFAGQSTELTISFSPTKWSLDSTSIIIMSSNGAFVEVFIQAMPTLNLEFPKELKFGQIIVGESKTRHIPLHNSTGFPIQFRLLYDKATTSYSISPIHGIIEPDQTIEISCVFLPLALCNFPLEVTFLCDLPLFKPRHCQLTGTGILQKIVEKKAEPVEIPTKRISTVRPKKVKPPPIEQDSVLLQKSRFEEESKKIAFIKREKMLKKFISVGIKPSSQNSADQSLRMSTALNAVDLELKNVVTETSFVKREGFSKEAQPQRLLGIFAQAVFTTIYRIRADAYLLKLREYKKSLTAREIAAGSKGSLQISVPLLSSFTPRASTDRMKSKSGGSSRNSATFKPQSPGSRRSSAANSRATSAKQTAEPNLATAIE